METKKYCVDRVTRYEVNATNKEAVQSAVDNGIIFDNMEPKSEFVQVDEPVSMDYVPVRVSNQPNFAILTTEGTLLNVAGVKSSGVTKDDVVGIVVETPLVHFIMSIDEWEEEWGSYEKKATEYLNESQAIQLTDGLEQTKRIVVAQKNEGMTAAKRCLEYKRGGKQFYLPTLLQLGTICAYQKEINKLLKAIGCEPLQSDRCYWCCTEWSSFYAWTVYFGSGNFNNNGKYYSYVVRAVAAF